MNLPPWIIDVFADQTYAGNPAAVIVADDGFPSLDDMQFLASRTGVPTTAFVVPQGPALYAIRWFTPQEELKICGHATLATAAYLYQVVGASGELRFVSALDELRTHVRSGMVSVDLPRQEVTPCPAPDGLAEALGAQPVSCAQTADVLVAEMASETVISELTPDFGRLKSLAFRGHVVTAAGSASPVDFVSRSFFPALGVDEDQVCVSAHRFLGPYWSDRWDRHRLLAIQLSQRGGRLRVDTLRHRVHVAGSAVVRGQMPVHSLAEGTVR